MCSLLCNFNCYCTLGASLMLALSAIDVSLHYYYMQNFHRKKKKKKKNIIIVNIGRWASCIGGTTVSCDPRAPSSYDVNGHS